MNYTYDIYLNFNKKYYDFFEWNKNDKIIHIKKIPIFKISEDNFKKIVYNHIKIDKDFLINVHNKTEAYQSNTSLEYCALFCNDNNIIAIVFDIQGNSLKKSSLYVDEEFEILETIRHLKEENINFEIIKKGNCVFKTRKQVNEELFINKELKNINDKKLNYIFFECFGKKNIKKKEILNKLKTINSNNNQYKKLYNILKLTSTNKNKML
ncbi:MAG: hypothetical protein Q4E75_05035 [bacterium]|nr:hypothetical protein [bacterium]